MEEITHGSLFTGRGGFDLAAEDLGIKTIWNCEIDPWLRSKLKRTYPDIKQYTNVKYVKSPTVPTIISAGFPCQDISIANVTAKGITGIRSGLFTEVARITGESKPQYLILENSPELLKRGFEIVLYALSQIGYDCQWECLQAADFGYPHKRERLYVIAYPNCLRQQVCIFKSPGTYDQRRSWTPTEAYLRMSVSRANGYRDIKAIQRGNVVPNFRREIKAYGNAVMPVIAEHLFQCILTDIRINKHINLIS